MIDKDLDGLLDQLASLRKAKAAVPVEHFALCLILACQAGCDRVPLRVRNTPVQFYLAGVAGDQVFLANAQNCEVSAFHVNDLEEVTVQTLSDIEELLGMWLQSNEGESAQSLRESAAEAAALGVKVPVSLRWPDSSNCRKGHLTNQSMGFKADSAVWVCGVEAVDVSGTIFRYGVTRLARSLHDGKMLTMMLKPGTPF